MLEYARCCQQALCNLPSSLYGMAWVEFRIGFARKFQMGPRSTTSTAHGLEFFDNVVACCEGRMEWNEKGEYGDNFRRLIATRWPWKTF